MPWKDEFKAEKTYSSWRTAQLPEDVDLCLIIRKSHYEPNKSHIHHYEMHFHASFTYTSIAFTTIVVWRNVRPNAVVIHFLKCAGFNWGPFVKIATALLYHPTPSRLHFLDNRQTSASDRRALGPRNGNWFRIALSSQFLIKCNMFRQLKTIFFFCSPWSFWL